MEAKDLEMKGKYQITPKCKVIHTTEQLVSKLQQQGINAQLCKRRVFK